MGGCGSPLFFFWIGSESEEVSLGEVYCTKWLGGACDDQTQVVTGKFWPNKVVVVVQVELAVMMTHLPPQLEVVLTRLLNTRDRHI